MATAAVRTDPIAALVAVCGAANVIVEAEQRDLYAHDVHARGATPLAIVRPQSREDAAAAVAVATRQGLAVHTRGGAMSYTDGHLARSEASILIDTRGLDRIIHIDARGLWVTAEAGCTWAKLDAALTPHGVRARFWGPFSGHDATVGGSMSAGAATFGSGSAGKSSANILGFEVALADGRRVPTGLDAQTDHVPFFDDYGPNITGLFANDAGALGVKLAVTLPLQPRAARVEGVSFVFTDFSALVAAMEAVSRVGLVSEALAMDRVVAAQFSGGGDMRRDLKLLLAMARGPGGLARAVRAALGGRGVLDRSGYNAHFIVEGRDAADARLKLAAVRALASGGREIPNTAPSAIRAAPFAPLPFINPKGKRFLPIHGIIPYAEAEGLDAKVQAVVARHRVAAAAAKLIVATSFFAVGANAFLYEPVFYWEDSLSPYQAARAACDARYPANPAARALVEDMRAEMVEAMFAHGAAHLQIGKAYSYARDRDLTLLRAVKSAVDPHNVLNPGALGL